MHYHLRIARPVSDLSRAKTLYCDGLGLRVLGGFVDHDGFDGVMVGREGQSYHFEFTHCRSHPLQPTPTVDDLAVFYIADVQAWRAACASMLAAGFTRVSSFNPYWDVRGQTFQDQDGYRVVLQNAQWVNAEAG
jgi:catechol 2,3-dioxygenase-like lactoylglutathione lyase family enzyme